MTSPCPGSRANVDHLVIGPTGVWVVDTKAYRGRVVARRRQVLVAAPRYRRRSVCWEAEVVSRLLGVEARPVIAVHARGLPRRGAPSERGEGVAGRPARAAATQRAAHVAIALAGAGVRELGQLAEQSLYAGVLPERPGSPRRPVGCADELAQASTGQRPGRRLLAHDR